MNNKLSKSDRTRQFIIETTAGIFNMKGYAGTSMSDITSATGLTKGSIYGNFANKEEVALAVFDFNYAKVVHTVEQAMKKAPTYFDKLMVYAQVYDQFNKGLSFPKGGCPILNTAIDADDTHELLRAKSANAVLKWKNKILELISKGVEQGEFKTDFDQLQLALSIIALIEGGVMIAKVTGNIANLDKVLKTVEALVLQIRK